MISSRETSSFWEELNFLTRAKPGLNSSEITARLTDLTRHCRTGDPDQDVARLELLKYSARCLNISLPPLDPFAPPPQQLSLGALPVISEGGLPGISLVTCSMNREENLLRALNSWMACPDLREIILVDWSSNRPVSEALKEQGIQDPRIKVIRVDGESRWILSYAFNVGFRAARCNRILKTDADIVLAPDFFQKNRLDANSFIAGNWRTATEAQSHVNGFFYLHKADLAAIGGFNEFITTYGWDDDDIYARLVEHGATRIDVAGETIHHLEHSDEERTGEAAQTNSGLNALQELQANTLFKIRRNRFLANVMPHWGNSKQQLPFDIIQTTGTLCTLKRTGWIPHPVPDTIKADATHYTALEMTAWRLGHRCFGLTRTQLSALLEKPFNDLGRLDVELALLGAQPLSGPALVVTLSSARQCSTEPGQQSFEILAAQARAQGLTVVLSGNFHTLDAAASATAKACPFLPAWLDLGTLTSLEPSHLGATQIRPAGLHYTLSLDAMLAQVPATADIKPAPFLHSGRPKLFIDGQHGLGNRLRAIGSAAAIAQQSSHELVIVWQPDSHCDCRFSDLFDYTGAVIEESFAAEAVTQGCRLYNYMEVEAGAEKDALIDVDSTASLYARAAYVLNSPLSNWDSENAFLQSLRPMEAVRDMVASVHHPNDVSAHVRMAGGKDYEHLAYEQSEGNWTDEGHQAIAHWREKSHFNHFFKRLDTLTAEGRAERIFVAADLPETYAEFKAIYGDRVAMLEREVYDRSAAQLRYALADALLLGSSPLLLGSSWSSFSELAMRLSPQKMTSEMSGKDF